MRARLSATLVMDSLNYRAIRNERPDANETAARAFPRKYASLSRESRPREKSEERLRASEIAFLPDGGPPMREPARWHEAQHEEHSASQLDRSCWIRIPLEEVCCLHECRPVRRSSVFEHICSVLEKTGPTHVIGSKLFTSGRASAAIPSSPSPRSYLRSCGRYLQFRLELGGGCCDRDIAMLRAPSFAIGIKRELLRVSAGTWTVVSSDRRKPSLKPSIDVCQPNSCLTPVPSCLTIDGRVDKVSPRVFHCSASAHLLPRAPLAREKLLPALAMLHVVPHVNSYAQPLFESSRDRRDNRST